MKLQSKSSIDWILNIEEKAVVPAQVHFGKGAQPIQIAVAEANAAPSRAILKTLFNDRKGRLQVSVMVAVEIGQEVHLFGPDPDSEVLVQKLAVATSFLNSVLEQENGILAYQRAISVRRSLQTTEMPGFTNNGLFASHYVRTSISSHPKWEGAQKQALELQGLRNRDLIDGLGFEVTSSPSRTLLLSAKSSPSRVVAILLEAGETFDSNSPRFQSTPVEWGLGVANQQGAPWVVAIRDSQIRLYPAKDGVGVGQKSQVETFFEVDLLTIDEEKAGLLSLIFSADALSENGTAEELLKNSHKFASDLGKRLRERVYESVVPDLAKEVANQLRLKGYELDAKGLQLAYELTLRILFRLLFQAYAEDRGLLPSGRNELFDSNSIKHWADHLLKRDPEAQFGESATIWFDLRQIWDAIDQGNPDMQIPAYNGGLFGSDPHLHPEGNLISSIALPDRVLGPALRALVVDDATEDGVAGPVDFRSLSVREFGTIYEGLLESSLSVADQDLTVDRKGAWVPAKEGDEVLATRNDVYFHSASGDRKSSGSYYTPSFVVDHLLEKAIAPALFVHLSEVKALINAGDQTGAYLKFFDFRIADLAMGSAHFLVAAIDKIETTMRSFLIQPGNEIDGVTAELLRLDVAAKLALGKDEAAYADIERSSLLRRQIARRCIYGLDVNPMAVELSRLAIWIHTFVPGLPMSSLNHNLVCANSLTGIGSVSEGLNALIPGREKNGSSLFDSVVEKSLDDAKQLLEDIANADEASKKEAIKAAESAKKVRLAGEKSKMIFDLAIANRNGAISTGAALTEEELRVLYSEPAVGELIDAVKPAHMPYLFPEVFLRENPGFDVLVGNPPWEALVYEEIKFWLAHFPGLKGQPVSTQRKLMNDYRENRPELVSQMESEKAVSNFMRKTLATGPFPGMTTGHPDLYKAFAWRFLQLVRSKGYCSVVLPRTALAAKGLELWRRTIAATGRFASVTTLVNKKSWVFEGVHERYSFALITIQSDVKGQVELAGPIESEQALSEVNLNHLVLQSDEILSWNEAATFPSFPSLESANVFLQMRLSPSIGVNERADLRFYPIQGDLNQTTDAKYYYADDLTSGSLPVVKGSTFGIWSPLEGELAGTADKELVKPVLEAKARRRPAVDSFGDGDSLSLPIDRARIAFRDITNATNTRTMISCLQPPGVVLLNSAPFLVNKDSDARKEAFLLGVLNSLVLDWYSRRFVELHMNFFIFNSLPVPEYKAGDAACKRIIDISCELSAGDKRSVIWLQEAGWNELQAPTASRKALLIAELDGIVAHVYGLDQKHLKHIFETFHTGWSDPARLKTALETLMYWNGRND